MRYVLYFVLLVVLAGGVWLFMNQKEALYEATRPIPPTLPTDYPVGGVLMIGHWADTPTASTTALIEEYQPAGVIIMSAPENPEDIRSWTEAWQAASIYPLLIAIDQEGGEVSRLRGEAFTQDTQRALQSEQEAYELGKERGEELAALGINMNFAPVLDTATSSEAFLYNRAFADPATAGVFAAAMTRGMTEAGVIAAAKHFPGHPNSPADSHHTLPEVDISRGALDAFTAPFRDYIIAAQPKALMTAHVAFPQIDAQPATLSHFWLTDYLRHTLSFQGVIVTDDMSMDAIDTHYTVPEASIASVIAGADLILLAADPQSITEVVPVINAAQQKNGALADRLRNAKLYLYQLRTSLQ